MPTEANRPCKVGPPASPMVPGPGDGQAYCLYPAYRETLPGGPSYTVLDQVENPRADDFPALKVPAGHIFLMGDNRDDSLDSRFTTAAGGIGLLPVENLVRRALVTFWSWPNG
jgi:signal peptidase I